MNRRALFSLSLAALSLGGCSKLKKLTGQTNDKVLPGQREDILPPDQYTAKSEDLTKKPQAEPVEQAPPPVAKSGTKDGEVCNPEVDAECVPAEGGGNDGVFNDG